MLHDPSPCGTERKRDELQRENARHNVLHGFRSLSHDHENRLPHDEGLHALFRESSDDFAKSPRHLDPSPLISLHAVPVPIGIGMVVS